MMDFRTSISKNISPYTPGEQPETKDWIKLNTNEFPYPPSVKVQEELYSITNDYSILRRYSQPYSEPLRSIIAQKYNISRDNVIVTNGSDEALTLIFRSFLEKGDSIAFPAVTYTLYETIATSVGATSIKVPMLFSDSNPFMVDIEQLAQTEAKVIFLPNPNALIGEYISALKLKNIITNSNKLWIIDEAYIGFVANESSASYLDILEDEPNVIVTRTLSKTHGLAGMRIGFAISKNQIIMNTLYGMKDSYNQDTIAIRLGVAAFKDEIYYQQKIQEIITERALLQKRLVSLGYFVIPSQANFILVKPKLQSAEQIYLFLKEHKILVRFFKNTLISDYLRITIGSPSENKVIIEKLSLL